jgi:hypothetical protein
MYQNYLKFKHPLLDRLTLLAFLLKANPSIFLVILFVSYNLQMPLYICILCVWILLVHVLRIWSCTSACNLVCSSIMWVMPGRRFSACISLSGNVGSSGGVMYSWLPGGGGKELHNTTNFGSCGIHTFSV